MNDIQQLIDRYLAEGLSSDELARLSRAVHRDDAPAEWLIIREMIDTLTEGEDDYDLILAARQTAEPAEASAPTSATSAPTSAIPAPAAEAPANPFLRLAFFRELAAASVFLAAVIGAAIYFTRDLEPQLAEVEKAYPVATDSPAVSPVPTTADSSAALVYAESSASEASSSASGASAASAAASSASAGAPVPVASAAGVSSSRVQPAARSSRQGAASSAAPQKAAAAKAAARHSETQSAEVSAEVPERRIYSCNLLDQIPENYEAPAHATDEY